MAAMSRANVRNHPAVTRDCPSQNASGDASAEGLRVGRQTGANHNGQAVLSDLGGPQSGARTGRMSHPRRLRSLRLLQFDRLVDSLPKQKP